MHLCLTLISFSYLWSFVRVWHSNMSNCPFLFAKLHITQVSHSYLNLVSVNPITIFLKIRWRNTDIWCEHFFVPNDGSQRKYYNCTQALWSESVLFILQYGADFLHCFLYHDTYMKPYSMKTIGLFPFHFEIAVRLLFSRSRIMVPVFFLSSEMVSCSQNCIVECV